MVRGYKTKENSNLQLHEKRSIVLDELIQGIKNDGRVCIERFGCFEVVQMKPRTFKNNNGRISKIAAYKKIAFRASLPLKKYLNER